MDQTDSRDTAFVDLSAALEGVDRDRLTIVPLFAGDDAGFTAHLVVWPPNAPSQACVHEDFAEAAHIVAGSIIDEDGTEHRAGRLWMRPPHHVHHPRAGTEGAQLVLWRAPVPACGLGARRLSAGGEGPASGARRRAGGPTGQPAHVLGHVRGFRSSAGPCRGDRRLRSLGAAG